MGIIWFSGVGPEQEIAMVDEQEVRVRVTDLFKTLPELLEIRVRDYFAGTELNTYQQEVVEEFVDLTIHEVMMRMMDSESQGVRNDSFNILGEIQREPLNHLNALYDFYSGVFPE